MEGGVYHDSAHTSGAGTPSALFRSDLSSIVKNIVYISWRPPKTPKFPRVLYRPPPPFYKNLEHPGGLGMNLKIPESPLKKALGTPH